jgi:putative ABC transport system permease protein
MRLHHNVARRQLFAASRRHIFMGLKVIAAAVRSLRRNAMRTSLSILSVSIGIAAVIATAALGGGSGVRIEQQMASLGDDFLWIRSGNRNVAGVHTGAGGQNTLTPDDATALARDVPSITACSPRLQGREQLVVGNQNWNTRYEGVSANFFQIRNRTIAMGSAFNSDDVASASRVMVLGEAVRQMLFGADNPIGREVRAGAFVFRVIGVLQSKGTDVAGLDRDDTVLVPITTAMRNFDRRQYVDDVMCSVVSPAMMDSAEAGASVVLRGRHRLLDGIKPDDFEVRKPIEFLQARAQTAATLRRLLIGIGSVSLLIGGIGIMNIMLVSVTERSQEIGVRMAIGARMRDIRRQFVLEAATIGLVGGLAGVVLGTCASAVFAAELETPMAVSPELILWTVGVAIAAGIGFGYWPAFRASTLDPIDAMRAET